MLCYKFGYTIEYVLSLSIPQVRILQSNLTTILKMENGGDKEGSPEKKQDNTLALEGIAKMLQEKTGRKTFTMEELMNPAATVKKYKKV